jgi:phage-related minor tail protein
MADAREKWDEVGERFGQLGRQLKDRFDANAAFGPDERETVTDALRQLSDASTPASRRSATPSAIPRCETI